MKSAKLSKNELIDLIFYSLNENNVDIKNINRSEIESIFADYIMFCNHFQIAYVQGELDTFKRAACLLVSINRGRLSKDKKTNASIALDAAYKMCEKPYWNVGENFDIPKKLEEVEFKKAFENNMYIYNKSKEMLIDSLVYENGSPLNYNLNLELLYQVALELKHNQIQSINSENQEKNIEEELSDSEIEKDIGRKRKILNLFKKPF
jgi:hypothetical protein